MPDRTHNSHGADAHQTIFYGVILVKCRQCQRNHRLLVSSNERNVAEQATDYIIRGQRAVGADPIGALVQSHHPDEDLTVRQWDACEELLPF